MSKSTKLWVISIIVIIVLVGGGYFIFHKSSPLQTKTTITTSSTTANSKTATKSTATPINNSIVITKLNSAVGEYLADPSGRTLYTYSGDENGKSNCTGSCLVNWPAYTANGSTTNLPTGFSTIKRSDNGDVQYTYNGMPLYFFVNDTNGQVTGNNVGDFHVAVP